MGSAQRLDNSIDILDSCVNSVKLIQRASGLKYEADRFVGFQITIQHYGNLELNLPFARFFWSDKYVQRKFTILISEIK